MHGPEPPSIKKDIDPFVAHTDLLCACRDMRNRLPCNIEFTHIKGHQNTAYPTVLSRAAWMNIKVDLLAKAKVDPGGTTKTRYSLGYKPWHVVIGSQ